MAFGLVVAQAACSLVADDDGLTAAPTAATDAATDAPTVDATSADATSNADSGSAADVQIDTAACDLSLPENCGACGIDCTNGHCNAGICTLLDGHESNVFAPMDLVVHESTIYFTIAGGDPGRVARCATNGCTKTPVQSILAPDASVAEPMAIAIDKTGTNVFWSEYYGAPAIYRTAIDGGETRALTPVGSIGYADRLRVVGNNVIWNDVDPAFASCPVSGCAGNPVPFAPGAASRLGSDILAAADGRLFLAGNGDIFVCGDGTCSANAGAVAVDQGVPSGALAMWKDNLYWGASFPATAIMWRDTKSANAPQHLVTPALVPSAMLVVGNNLYWALGGLPSDDGGLTTDGKVQKCELPDCSTVIDIVVNEPAPTALATDGKSIIWVSTGDRDNVAHPGLLRKAPL